MVFGDGAANLHSNIRSQLEPMAAASALESSVNDGYKAIYSTTADNILNSPVGALEILIGNNVDGGIRIGAALQHPLSQGRIYINSSNPIDYPVIDPNYLSHPAGKLCRPLVLPNSS
jgi:hypothetical protein